MKQKRITPAFLNALLDGDFENALIASIPEGIEVQEKQGQDDLVNDSDKGVARLPKKCPKENLEKMGIEFLTDADDLFVNVILPKGWKIKATENSRWSYLIDDKDNEIASIFYKAAFYDRKAFLELE